MSNDLIAKIHIVVREPLRQKILLQLVSRNMTFNDFMSTFKIKDKQELNKQLDFLEKVKIQKEYLVVKQTDLAYQITEKGRYVLEKMNIYPQLSSNNYTKLFRNIAKPKQKWVKPYSIIIAAATIIIGITLPFTQNITLGAAILILILALVVEGLVHYVRFLPSLTLNRGTYILIGIPIGFVIWLDLTAFYISINRWVNENFIIIFGSLAACLGIGALIGDLIGKLRKYKGPEQYQI
jgi:hypothetical protein